MKPDQSSYKSESTQRVSAPFPCLKQSERSRIKIRAFLLLHSFHNLWLVFVTGDPWKLCLAKQGNSVSHTQTLLATLLKIFVGVSSLLRFRYKSSTI